MHEIWDVMAVVSGETPMKEYVSHSRRRGRVRTTANPMR